MHRGEKMNNILVEKFQKKLGCGAVVTRYRETIFEQDDEQKMMHGEYFKDRLWEEEN